MLMIEERSNLLAARHRRDSGPPPEDFDIRIRAYPVEHFIKTRRSDPF
jgi:hypothetical protein